jgi:hypothetical protein
MYLHGQQGYFPSCGNANNEKWRTTKEIRILLAKVAKLVGSGLRANKISRHFFEGFNYNETNWFKIRIYWLTSGYIANITFRKRKVVINKLSRASEAFSANDRNIFFVQVLMNVYASHHRPLFWYAKHRHVAGHPSGQISESPVTQQRPIGSLKDPIRKILYRLSKNISSAFIFTIVCGLVSVVWHKSILPAFIKTSVFLLDYCC